MGQLADRNVPVLKKKKEEKKEQMGVRMVPWSPLPSVNWIGSKIQCSLKRGKKKSDVAKYSSHVLQWIFFDSALFCDSSVQCIQRSLPNLLYHFSYSSHKSKDALT